MNRPLLRPEVPVNLANCDLEPIHIPSFIQPHGMLLAARTSDYRVVYTSENSPLFLGVTPSHILERTLPELLGSDAMEKIEGMMGEQQYVPKNIQTYKFPMCGQTLFDVTVHRINGLLCIELELAGEHRQWEMFAAILENAMRTLTDAKTVGDLCFLTPNLLRELTGFDRVMVYKFDPDGHGEIVGEQKGPGMEPFLGLHYPATDIPRQARKLYLLQRVRTIVDVDYVPVALISNRELVMGEPLDMTYCGLRSISPIHVEYLQNMGVGATLAISLIQDGELWGLIVGHHQTPKHLSPQTRALCHLLGHFISSFISVAERADTAAEYRRQTELLDTLGASIETDLAADAGLAMSGDALLRLVEADGAIVSLDGHISLVGKTPLLAEAQSLLSAFQSRHEGNPDYSNEVGALLPSFAHLAPRASGALLVTFHEPTDGILWIRGEMTEGVHWAGKPDAVKLQAEGSLRLSPRKSFALWEQVQAGRSLPWQPAHIEAALRFQRIAVIALLRRSEAKLLALKHSDLLTGLPNRAALLERLATWRDKSTEASASLLFLDLDNFKSINDRLGHSVGDEFLKQVGRRMSLLGDGKYFIARLGGDEFAVFCEHTNIRQAELLASSILDLFREPFLIKGVPLATTTSIGIAPMDENLGARMSDPLRVADSAMYVAKHKGGNQFSIVESREQAEILRLTIEGEVWAKRLAAIELANAYAHMKSVMDSTSEGVLDVNHDWTVRYGNRRAAEHLPDFRVGRSLWTCFPALCSSPLQEELRVGMTLKREVAFEHYDPVLDTWYRGKVFPAGEGMSVFFNNITLEKKMRDQMALEDVLREKRIEALSHMAGGLAHEISNPLAIIHGKASELKRLADNDVPVDSLTVRTTCESILKVSNRASNILRGLRGFAREGGQDPMELASIYEIVDQCLEMQQSRFELHQVEIRLALDQGVPRFLCRQVQVEQILTNLINNAFDAVTQSGTADRWMTIAVQWSPTTMSLYVTDSGPGIHDHFRVHLMEPFFTTKEFGLGMGVGLSLSRAIAHDHKGTLTLLQGTEHTCFRLTLPITPDVPAMVVDPCYQGVPHGL